MFTENTHSTLVAMAGPNFTWEGMSSSRPANDSRTPLRSGLFAWLLDYSDGVCAFCGDKLEDPEACHIVSGGPGRRGWVEGNVAMGCSDCNELDRQNGPVVEYRTIVRPDLVPTVWPDRDTLVALGRDRKAAAEKRRSHKRSRRYGE